MIVRPILRDARKSALLPSERKCAHPGMTAVFASIPRHNTGRQDCFEVIGTVAIGVSEVLVGDTA
jgi:hypothetical protein